MGLAPRRDDPRPLPASRLPSRRAGSLGVGLRRATAVGLLAMVVLSGYGSVVPASVRCNLPAGVGCPGGVLGPALQPATAGVQWFDVVMYDWGFWIVDSTSGVNETNAWNVFEGWTVHVNATSQAPDVAIGGTAYHGLGLEINATGQQLLSLAAPVGKWVSASFVAPLAEYHHQHLWCTIACGPGHGGQQAWVLNVIPPSILPVAHPSANVTRGAAPLTVGFTANGTAGAPPYNYSWNFGDGTPSTFGAAPSHTFTLGGVYYATLTVTDAKGYQGSASVTVTVLSGAPLTASIAWNATDAVAPAIVSYGVEAHGGLPPYSYAWAFGDGSTASAPNATSHFYGTPGLYATLVTVLDSAGARASVIAAVPLVPATGTLAVSLNASVTTGTAPFLAVANVSASGGSAPYVDLWDFGDGSFGSGTSATHTYNLTGSYEATVFAVSATGAVGSATKVFAVTAPTTGGGDGGSDDGGGVDTLPAVPVAAAANATTLHLTVAPSSGPSPLSVSATVSVVGGSGVNETASWTFGDGATATGQKVNHTYTAEGVYTLGVSTRDSSGASASATTSVVVGGPVVRLVENATIGDAPFSVLAAASVTGGSGVYGPLAWSWGDGGSSTGNVSAHAYGSNATGTVTVVASVVDSAGVAGANSSALTIDAPPTATLAVGPPTTGGLPVSVGLALTVHGGTGVYASQVLWAFGDGTSGLAAPVTSHAFTKFGHFLVTVSTTDSYGRSANASAWVNLSFNLSLPKGTAPVWSFTGVPDPSSAALALLGLVGLTGLAFLYRRRARPPGRRPGGPAAATPASAAPASPRTGPEA